MDAELILKYVEALKWPIVLLVFLWIFKSEWKALLLRLSEFEGPGGIKGKFTQDIKEAKKEADKAGLPEVLPDYTAPTTTTKNAPSMEPTPPSEMRSWPPDVAIPMCFIYLNGKLAESLSIPFKRAHGIEFRIDLSKVKPSLRNLYFQLEQIRNKVVHDKYSAIPQSEAEEYIDLTERLLSELKADGLIK